MNEAYVTYEYLMDEHPLNAEEHALLAAWLKTAKAGALAPTAADWADWLAGRLDEAAAAPLEQALAQDAGLRAALLAVHQGALEIASADEISRARGLVRSRKTSIGSRSPYWSWRSLAAASFVIAASGLGWVIGFSAAADAVNTAAASAMDIFGTGMGL
jgi:hypothetical protein